MLPDCSTPFWSPTAARSPCGSSARCARMGIRSVAVLQRRRRRRAPRRARPTSPCASAPPPARRELPRHRRGRRGRRERTGAQAVHPGYGFLSENAAFAAALRASGHRVHRPAGRGDRRPWATRSPPRPRSSAFGVPVVPGVRRPGLTDADLIAAADEVGYPVLVKPSAGGGGKGMRVVHEPPELRRGARQRAAGGGVGVRRRHAVPRAVRVATPAHRGAGARRRARQRASTSASASAACSAVTRRSSRRRRRPCWTPETRARIGAAACDTARSVGLHRRGHRGVHRLRGPPRRVLLHGDEHPPAGRAPGHRAGHRHRPGRAAAPHRGRGEAGDRAGRHHA